MNQALFAELLESVKEGGRILRESRTAARTSEVLDPDVRAIRQRFNLTQEDFALLLGISVRTLQNWEQGRRRPEGPARVLLQVAAQEPGTLLKVAGAASWA